MNPVRPLAALVILLVLAASCSSSTVLTEAPSGVAATQPASEPSAEPTPRPTAAPIPQASPAQAEDVEPAELPENASDAARWDAVVLARYRTIDPTDANIAEFAVLAGGICLEIVTDQQIDQIAGTSLFAGLDGVAPALRDLRSQDCDEFASGVLPAGPSAASTWDEMIAERYAAAVPWRDLAGFDLAAREMCDDGLFGFNDSGRFSESENEQLRAIVTHDECRMAIPDIEEPDPQPEPTPQPSLAEPPPGLTGRLVFTSPADGDEEIYAYDLETGEPERITDNTYWDGTVNVSPDGSLLAYVISGDPEASQGLGMGMVVQTDGTGERSVTGPDVYTSGLAVSHEGNRLAYIEGGGRLLISEGYGHTPYYATPDEMVVYSIRERRPTLWRPGDDMVAFFGWVPDTGTRDLYVVDTQGGDPVAIAPLKAFEALDWHPDGTRLAIPYHEGEDQGATNIYTVNVDGSGFAPLIETETQDLAPRWSPDGEWIGFMGQAQVWIARSDGTDLRQITELQGGDRDFRWAPDSRHLVVSHDIDWRDDTSPVDLYISDLEGNLDLLPIAGDIVAWIE